MVSSVPGPRPLLEAHLTAAHPRWWTQHLKLAMNAALNCRGISREGWVQRRVTGLPSAATATLMPCSLPCLAKPQASAKPAQLLCQLPVLLPSLPSAACLLSLCRGATWPILKGRNIRLTCEPLQPWYPGTTTLLLRRETWLDEWEGEGRVEATYIYILHPVLPIPSPWLALLSQYRADSQGALVVPGFSPVLPCLLHPRAEPPNPLPQP